MKATFDISVLGRGHHDTRSRAGIFRVVESLALGLARSPRCDLTFSAVHSFRSLYQSLDYLRATPRLRSVPLPYSRAKRFLDASDPDELDRLIDRRPYPRRALLRGRRKLVNLLRRHVDLPVDPADVRALARSDIFHSPFFAVPEFVRRSSRAEKFLTIHDVIPLLFPELFDAETVGFMGESVRQLQQGDWIIAVSHSTKRDLCNHVPMIDPDRVFVIHNGVADHFRPCPDAAWRAVVRAKYGIPEAPYLLSLGLLEPRKNLDHLIRCFAAIVETERIRDLNLVLVGARGWQYEEIINAAHLANTARERIFFTGYVDDADLSAVYSGAQAFVYPSLYEGFGLPPLEAMNCGVPVITSNTSAFPEVVGEAGIMVDPRDADALSQALLYVHASETLRAELSAKSLARAREFSWEACTQQTLNAYEASLSAKSRGGA